MALGVVFVSLGEGIDCTTPAGKSIVVNSPSLSR
jgi:hypothetical protein